MFHGNLGRIAPEIIVEFSHINNKEAGFIPNTPQNHANFCSLCKEYTAMKTVIFTSISNLDEGL